MKAVPPEQGETDDPLPLIINPTASEHRINTSENLPRTSNPEAAELVATSAYPTSSRVVSNMMEDSETEVNGAIALLGGSKSQIDQINKMGCAECPLTYDAGYGDFCFGRWCLRNERGWWGAPPTGEDLRVTSSAFPTQELNGFVRSGPFQYYKLPKEIRDRIIRLLLEPLHRYGNEDGPGFIEITIANETYTEELLGCMWSSAMGNSEMYLEGKAFYDSTFSRPSPGSAEYLLQESVYKSLAADRRHFYRNHPGRCHSFAWIVESDIKIQKWPYYHTDWYFLNWFRRASNISRHFRADLGEVFWSRVHLNVRTEYRAGSILKCINERPGIVPGIKRLDLDMNLEDQTMGNHSALLAFVKTCEGLSAFASFRLEILVLILSVSATDESALSEIVKGVGVWDKLRACSTIAVAKSFTVRLCIGRLDTEHLGDDEDEDVYQDYLRLKYEPVLRDLMLPHSLRPKPPSTDTEIYLASRSESNVNQRGLLHQEHKIAS